MKRMASLVSAAVALALAASVYATTPGEQPSVEQAAPAAQPAAPPGATSATPSAEQSTHLAALMPPGMSGQEACTGFKAVNDCAAALHASHNLGIQFADLKAKVTGGRTLTAAIHELKPDANASAEAGKAEEQARRDLRAPSG